MMSITVLGDHRRYATRLTLPPDSLMLMFRARMTVRAVNLAVGAVGGDSNRHGGNVLGDGEAECRGRNQNELWVYIRL